MSSSTNDSYQSITLRCKEIFLNKTRDYGTSWRVLRDIAVVDQIYIKVKRICTLQEDHIQAKIDESIHDEWIGVINYAVIGLIQRKKKNEIVEQLSISEVQQLYEAEIAIAFELMQNKNHDYGEAWRDMHAKSIADIAMMKVHRMRQILENKELLRSSEGLEANYLDLINYAIFYLILFQN